MHDAGDRNHRILCALRPAGWAVPESFGADTTAVPTPGPGQFLSRTLYLSIDPTVSLNPGDVVGGETVAQVLESRHPEHRPGEFVVVRNGWQQFALSSGQGVRRLDANSAPVSAYLGVLGLPGLLGYSGLIYLGEPRPGETVLVSDPTGPVGCTVGQAARIVGARAVGIASSREKCEYAVGQLGFAACICSTDPDAHIHDACPDGVDVYFDTVGGEGLARAFECLAPHARVILGGPSEAYSTGLSFIHVLNSRASVRGIFVQDHLQRLPELQRVVGSWIRAGLFRYREDMSEGLAAAPEAYGRLMRGEGFGKVLVRVAPEHL
ncbi:MAG: NADP-dependent oxidoreductase [Proteobacteria bacterium]|nr:NADP-dependent oxidoreductase [Pseudomonadota bacterium]